MEENLEEYQYLNACREIISSGVARGDRTGVGTLSKFGTQARFNLREGESPEVETLKSNQVQLALG